MRRLRSLLFVPGDRPERVGKAVACGADALILDLEDSVAPGRKAAARAAVAAALAEARRAVPLFVRVNPLASEHLDQDLAAVVPGSPDGLVLPKAESGVSVAALLARAARIDGSSVPVLPIATETPAAVFGLGSYSPVAANLCGLTWGAEDLPASIGATTSRELDGRYTSPYEVVRALALFGAHAAGVPAIETVFPDFRDVEGLRAYAARARRDGFTGMMAIHPTQVPAINAAFMPSDDEVAWARKVVEAFAGQPGSGVVNLDGRMLDAPHRTQAERILSMGDVAR